MAGNQASASKSDCALATMVSKATRYPTSGPSTPPMNRTPTAWNGTDTLTAVEGRAHQPAPTPTSNASAPRPSGQTPASGSRHNSRTSNHKYRPSDKRKPNATLREVLPQDWPLPDGTIPVVDHEQARRHVLVVQLQGPNARASVQELPAVEKPTEGSAGGGRRSNRPGQRPVQDFADKRCSKAILDFLATTEVGRIAGPPLEDGEPGREGEERENARNTLHRWRWKRERWESGNHRLSFFLFSIYLKHI